MKRSRLLLLAALTLCLSGCQKKAEQNTPRESLEHIITVDASKPEQHGKNYQTMSSAVDYINENPPASEKERIVLLISEGTYREHTVLNAPYVTYRAEKSDSPVVLTFYYGAQNRYKSIPDEEISISTSASTVISEQAHDFCAEHITFENSYNLYTTEEEKTDFEEGNPYSVEERSEDPALKKYQTQACCIQIAADRSTFTDCSFIGRQDTIFMTQLARCYFEDCFIEGTADFICGGATAWFENCTLNCPYNAGYVSASASGSNNPYGYLFHNCSITKKCEVEGHEPPKDGDYALGRPWRCTPCVIFWNCKMDTHIVTGEDRFVNMVSEYSRNDCSIIECNSMDINGTPLDMETIKASYEMIFSEQEMKELYSPERFFYTKYNEKTESFEEADGWLPTPLKQ